MAEATRDGQSEDVRERAAAMLLDAAWSGQSDLRDHQGALDMADRILALLRAPRGEPDAWMRELDNGDVEVYLHRSHPSLPDGVHPPTAHGYSLTPLYAARRAKVLSDPTTPTGGEHG